MGAAHGSGLGNIIPDPQRRVEQVMYFCHADLKEKGPLIFGYSPRRIYPPMRTNPPRRINPPRRTNPPRRIKPLRE